MLGSGLDIAFGWRATFAFVAIAAAVRIAGYLFGLGETHPSDRRAAHTIGSVARAYGGLAKDGRFILPALAVSLTIGGLYAFFGATPAILVEGIGLSATELGLFFAATVFVVFGAAFAAPKLAHGLGPARAALLGAVIALAGGAALLAVAHAPNIFSFSAATVVLLLGILQMASAAMGTALTAGLSMPPAVALGFIMTAGVAVAVLLLLGRLVLRPA